MIARGFALPLGVAARAMLAELEGSDQIGVTTARQIERELDLEELDASRDHDPQ